jgi:hypothetical protein
VKLFFLFFNKMRIRKQFLSILSNAERIRRRGANTPTWYEYADVVPAAAMPAAAMPAAAMPAAAMRDVICILTVWTGRTKLRC